MPSICRSLTARSLCAISLALAGAAHAEEIAAPSNTFELSLGLGYGQGVGPVAAGLPRLQDLGDPGVTVLIDAGWRIDPRFLVGAYGEVSAFEGGSLAASDHATSVGAGVQGQFHVMPTARWDPWIGVGFGWRAFRATTDVGSYKLHGLDLARIRLGVDYRASPHVAIGPVLGVTLTEFLSEKHPGSEGYTDTTDRKVNTFVFAGLAGRFDL